MQNQEDKRKEKAFKSMLMFGIFSIVMLFAGLTSAYIVSMGDSFWLKTPLPNAFWVSTVILVLSSISIEYAVKSSKRRVKKSNMRSNLVYIKICICSRKIFFFKYLRHY